MTHDTADSPWPTDPVPVPGCGDCTALAADLAAARDRQDPAGISDARVLLRRHLTAAHPQ